MRETIEVNVNDRTFEIHHLPTLEALRIFTLLTKLVGDSLGKAIGSFKGNGNILDADVDVLGDAISLLCQRLDEKNVQDIINTILKYTFIQGEKGFEKIAIDTHFAGRLGDLFSVVYESFKHNYADVLESIKKKINALREPVK